MKKTIVIAVALMIVATAEATPKIREMRCEKAQKELGIVNAKLAKVNPDYEGGLKREKALWEKQVRDNCGSSRWGNSRYRYR